MLEYDEYDIPAEYNCRDHIVCPYCFAKFSHKEVMFRANTAYSQKDLLDNDEEDGGLLSLGGKRTSSQDIRPLFQEFVLGPDNDRTDPDPNKKIDDALERFWRLRGGHNGFQHVDPNWKYPHIDPKSQEFFDMVYHSTTIANMEVDEEGFVTDSDGFVLRVVDKKSDPTMPMTRLCPNCHNPLPLPDYGKYPLLFISVVGDSSAGKTVYLNQLLTRFPDSIRGTGYRYGSNNLHIVGEPIASKRALPAATDPGIMRRPLAVTLMPDSAYSDELRSDTYGQGLTLVFYDIAGENCIITHKTLDAQERLQALVGRYVAFCDAVVLLIDPSQLPVFDGGNPAEHDINSIASQMINLRVNLRNDVTTWDNVPVAVTISKSDTLQNNDHTPADHPIHNPTTGHIGYNRDGCTAISKFLDDLLDKQCSADVAPLSGFSCRQFFAVSAITCGVEARVRKYQNEYILSQDNERKFDKLRKWVREWNKRTPDERQFFQKCSIRDIHGNSIEFQYIDSITKENADNILTEIKAESINNGSINLTLWDVATALDKIGYPVSDPNPRRVSDPLKWILWRKRIIGPWFDPWPELRKPVFTSQRRWNEQMAIRRQEEAEAEREFYGETAPKSFENP